jgi:hypothetical protein
MKDGAMLKIRCSHFARALAMNMSLLAAATVGAGVLCLAPQALARQTSAKFVAPIADGVNIRCGSSVAWYTVATLNIGTAVRALDETDGWMRVEYPAGTPIVVKSDEAEVRGGTVVLSRRSRLRAYNPASPVIEECYKAVFDQFLLPGVEMKYLGPVKGRDGAVMGLLAEAPAGATGYVLAREVRDATPGEIAKVAGGASAPAQPSAQPPAQPATQPAPTAQAPVTDTTTDQQAANPSDEAGADQPVTETDTLVVETLEVAETPASQPAASAEPARVPTLRELDAAFEQMMRQPLEAADPNELIEQFRAYQAANSDELTAARTGEYISTRITALELRAKARSLSEALSNLDQRVQNASESYSQTIERLSKGREYQVVGRLLPSTVYDGKRLPLMFRLTSIDSSASRTLAYIAPEPSLDLDKKVGSIVGVLGESTLEPAAMVSVIRPVAVDVLQASPSNQ